MSKPVRAGKLRHRVTIEREVIDIDSDGAQVPEWMIFAGPVPAEIAPVSGRELLAAQAVSSKVSSRIKMRRLDGVTAGMRAVHRSTIYNIEAVIPDPDSGIRFQTLLVTDGVNQG